MRIVCISDTHNQHDLIRVPDGDLLIHAGDLTGYGILPQIEKAADWLRSLPHPQKIVIAGNHDWGFQNEPEEALALMDGLTYLEDAEVVVGGLRIWGSPWQPAFCDWAFNLEPGEALRKKWDLIPEGIDILVTHGPPRGQGDVTFDGRSVGCEELLDAVRRIRPAYHVFGHIHEGYGVTTEGATTFVNASNCDHTYAPINAPIVLEV